MQLVTLLLQLLLLCADNHFFQLCQIAQFQFQNSLSLNIGDPETLHKRGLGLFLCSNDMNHFVNIKERNEVTVQDMQSLQYAIEAVFQPTPNGRGAKFQPLLENSIQPFNPWATVDTDHIEIDAVAAFQIRTGVQVAHKSLKVDAVGAWHHNQARRVFMI